MQKKFTAKLVIRTIDITVVTAHIRAEYMHLGCPRPVHRSRSTIRAVQILNPTVWLDLFLFPSYTNLSNTKKVAKKNVL